MENLSTITVFLGWCTLINTGILLYASFMLIIFNAPIKKLHRKILHLPSEKIDELYFNFLAKYKLIIIVFNLVPYFALKIMA
jgi:Zn-dependent protease